MMRLALFVLSPIVFIGCAGEAEETLPFDVSEAFESTENAEWEFMNENPAVSYKLIGTLAVDRADADVYTVKYAKHCMANDASCETGELVRAISWSNDALNGVLIHEINDAGVETVFEPPLALAASEMYNADFMVTETAGYTWTSTLVASETCPVDITGGIGEDCLRISLSDGGMGATNPALVGEYWAVSGYGIVAMDVASDEGRWKLLDYTE